MKNRNSRIGRHSWLGVEALEPRLSLAADGITASVNGGHLMIKGGKDASVIIINDTDLPAGQIRISTGDSGIKINRQLGDVILDGITRDIKFVLGKGSDNVTMTGISAPKNISVIGASGDDHVTFTDVIAAGDVSFVGASGDDRFTFTGGSVGDDLKLVTGPDSDKIVITNVDIDRDLSINAGPGPVDAALLGVTVGRKTNVQTGPADDIIKFDNSIFDGSVRVHAGNGADHVLIETRGAPLGVITHFESSLTVSMSNGDDRLQVGIANEAGHHVMLGGKTLFDGGPGRDTLGNPAGNGAAGSSRLKVVKFEEVATAATVTATSPLANATGVSVNTTITATFSVPMQIETINTSNFLVSDSGGSIAGTVAYNGLTATFTPSSSLDSDTVYTVRITTNTRDLAGVPIALEVVWQFTTA